jgi:small subunit ribosomal protein S4
MGHYTGPKSRVNRRLGAMIYENAGARRAYERRNDSMPGMHARRSKLSGYGRALLEKQKIKHFYGLSEGNSAVSTTRPCAIPAIRANTC